MLTLEKFEEASEKVKEVVLPTNLIYSEYFSAQTGNKVYLKPENMQYTGAYKVRGAYYKISTLSEEERKKGLITASAGNHAQGVAYAAKIYGVPATIVMPTTTPLIKVNRTKSYGAEVVLYGNVYDEACQYALKLAKEKDILMVVDEVQTGNGRTGRYFAYENFDIKPDIVSTAKGLAGGLPMGAVLFGEKVKDTVTPGSHGSTFGGNPVCAAGAISIVSRIDDKFLKSVREKSEYIKNFLMNIKGVKSVSGMGLMLGVETQKDAKQIASECLENGLLVLTAKTKIRLLPALNISYLELDRGLKILKEVIEK